MNSLRSINGTYIFKLYDKTLNLNETIIKLATESKILGDEEIGEYITSFDRRYFFPLKNKTIDDYRNHRVLPIYNDKNYRLPNTIPCFLIKGKQGITCIVNTTNYMTVNRNGLYTIDAKMLYSLMQGGTIMATCYQKYLAMKNKVSIIRYGSYIYSLLFSKVMNKLFSLNITPAKTDIVIYLSGLFFIHNLLGRDEESLEELNSKYAMENCKDASTMVIDDVVRNIDPKKDFENFDTFIRSMARNVPGLEDLNTRAFTDQYVSAYGPNMLLSLEFLPTFLFNMGAVTVGAFLNNQNVIENVATREIQKLMAEFSTL